jgi:hypothetical protein
MSLAGNHSAFAQKVDIGKVTLCHKQWFLDKSTQG